MAIPLTMGYLAQPSCKPRHEASAVAKNRCAGRDAIEDRPRIPRGVITWPDLELPVGAGDPASDIAGPARFQALGSLRRRSWLRSFIDGLHLG